MTLFDIIGSLVTPQNFYPFNTSRPRPDHLIQPPMQQTIIDIESLDMEARGIGHLHNEDGTPGKVIFVEGALPKERVSFVSYRKKAKWEAARVTALHNESSL